MKIELKINGKEISLSQKTIESIKKVAKINEGLWKPKKGEAYWYIKASGYAICIFWDNDEVDKQRYAFGNCFQTKELAEKEVAKRKAIQNVKEYIAENFGVFELDWEDDRQEKYTLNCNEKCFDWERHAIYKEYSPIGHLKSGEDCEQLIKDKGKELRIIWDL